MARPFLFFMNWERSDGETGTATTGFGGVGIVEGETTGIESALPVYFHTGQVDAVRPLHHHGNAVDIELVVLIGFGVETEYIGHPAATTPFYANTQVLARDKISSLHQAHDLRLRGIGESYRQCGRFHIDYFKQNYRSRLFCSYEFRSSFYSTQSLIFVSN